MQLKWSSMMWVLIMMGSQNLCADFTEGSFLYVQSVKAPIRKEPQVAGEVIKTFNRGQKVKLKKVQGFWCLVESSGTEGWTSRLFLSEYAPIGKNELIKLPQTVEKASRRRTSSYSTSASTRGLMMGNRSREGREINSSDYDALEKLEAFKLSTETYNTFKKTLIAE